MAKAFGLIDYTMIPKINRLLKAHGVRLKTKTRREDDQVEITVVDLKPELSEAIKAVTQCELVGAPLPLIHAVVQLAKVSK